MAIFNPNRKTGGTIELVRDADGNYSTKEVGFNTLASLSIPDFKTTATTTTTTDTKTAADITGDTVDTQTQMAFQMPDRGNNQIDTTGDMLQTAKQTSDMLAETFDSPEMRKRDEAKITLPLQIKEADERISAQEAAPQEDIGTEGITNFTDYQDAILRGKVGTKFQKQPKFGDSLFEPGPAFQDKGTTFSRPEEGTIDQAAADNMTQEGTTFARPDRGTIDQIAADSLGITKTKPLDTARFEGVSKMGALAGDEKDDVKPVKKDALQTVSTSLKSAFKNIKTPTTMLIDAVAGEPTAVQNHDKQYFTDRGDGRIGGNPATDLYAGMNRTSMFGNLEKAGEKRISRREKTIEKKGYGPGDKFYDDTQNMKDQQKSYKASLDKKTSTRREAGSMNQPGRGGDQSGRSGGKIVCTMMNESYGFGSFRNKIWLRHSKNLAPEYQIGYHRIFLPLVKKAKTNKTLKKILEHIAIHRTIDIRQEERNKIHLLGRVYRTILEPICYWVGKI
jgi:hypothetical protein